MPLKGAITSHWSLERWCSISLLDDWRLRKMLGCDSVPIPFFQQTSILHEIILMINSNTFKFGNLSRALLNQIINWKFFLFLFKTCLCWLIELFEWSLKIGIEIIHKDGIRAGCLQSFARFLNGCLISSIIKLRMKCFSTYIKT